MRCLAWLVALPFAVPGVARADDDRPAVAVLGVIPKHHRLTDAADTMTDAIRAKAGAKASSYRVKGSRKVIDAAITTADCSSIQLSCAVALGASLDVDYTIAGELDLRGTHQVLVLALVDVRSKQRLRAVRQVAATKSDAKKLARSAYTKLLGGELGTLSIVANAQHGEVLIDGQVAAALFEGRATIEGLVNGTHQLSIRARGYRPFDIDVRIEYATKENVLLDPEPEPEPAP
jgi:hypothetical protein